MRGRLTSGLAACFLVACDGHAFLVDPRPRVAPEEQPPTNVANLEFGLKRIATTNGVFSLALARSVTDTLTAPSAGCGPTPPQLLASLAGGPEANAKTAAQGPPSGNYTAGQSLTVKWKLSIPHGLDNTRLGVRIAVIYPPANGGTDSEMRVLAGAPSDGLTVVPGAPALVPADGGSIPVAGVELKSVQVRLPKTPCERCVLQWLWIAENDGGYYLDCADISIKDAPEPTLQPTGIPTPLPEQIGTKDIEISIQGHEREGLSESETTILKSALQGVFDNGLIRTAEIRDQTFESSTKTLRTKIRVTYGAEDSKRVDQQAKSLNTEEGKKNLYIGLVRAEYPGVSDLEVTGVREVRTRVSDGAGWNWTPILVAILLVLAFVGLVTARRFLAKRKLQVSAGKRAEKPRSNARPAQV